MGHVTGRQTDPVLSLLAGTLTPNNQENDEVKGSQSPALCRALKTQSSSARSKEKTRGDAGRQGGKPSTQEPTTSHGLRQMTESKSPAPQPLQAPTQRASLSGLGSRWSHGSSRPPLHPRDPVARSWLRDSRAPGAARAAREDGGRRATAPPALATGQAQRHLSALRPAAPTPRSRFRGEAPWAGKKKKKSRQKKNHPNTKSPPRRSPPNPGPQADTTRASQAASAPAT